MARAAGTLCLLLICVLAFVNVETRIQKRVTKHTYPAHHSSGHKPIAKHTSGPVHHAPSPTHHAANVAPPKTGSQVHSYPNSDRLSGGGRHVTSAPNTARIQAPQLYPPSNGGSGAGYKPPYQQPGSTSGAHSYPPSNSGSGAGYKPPYQQPGSTSGAHSYPPSNSGSGAGYKPPYQQSGSTSGAHSYPPSSGGSGAGYKPYPQYPHPGTGSYPHPPKIYPGNSGSTNINTGHTGYNSHVYVRNQHTTNIYASNIRTTNIHHYHYNPPPRVYYSSYGSQPVYYPVYSGALPLYVYEYRSSRSRYSKLLAGLALYNLGLVSRNHQAQHYHNHYVPRTDEVCKFGVRYDYDMRRSEEMEIDCRLMTDFIWTESSQISQTAVIGNQLVLPNGTLVGTQIASTDVANALDPRFNGAPINVRSGMKCYMKWSVSFTYTRTKDVDCGLLQTYVDKSLNSATKVTSAFLITVASVTVLLLN